jgi:hypothetical protein
LRTYNPNAEEVGGLEVFLYLADQNFEHRLKFQASILNIKNMYRSRLMSYPGPITLMLI